MSTIVLVHGAFADQTAWAAVKPVVESKGHQVHTLDLPGHGADATPVAEISLAAYIDAVSKAIAAQSGKVTLVGHSMAGMVISGVAEKHPEKIDRLIYVAAYLPQSGQSLQALAQTDPDSLVGANMEFAPDYSTVMIRKDRIIEAICADVPSEIQGFIANGQKPEPLKPFSEPVELTAENFGRIPKFYIETTEDRAVTNALQRRMIEANGSVQQVLTMKTSHLPFVAQPAEFASLLLGWV